MRVRKRKWHYIYKTVCAATSMYYIGMHSTTNLEDGYIGSGKKLWWSIRRYGKENHKITILEFLEDRKSLIELEKKIVNEEILRDGLCMNLIVGGEGGWNHQNSNSAIQRVKCLKGIEKQRQLRISDTEWKSKETARRSLTIKKQYTEGTRISPLIGFWNGRKHLEETKKKIGASNSIRLKGCCNPMFGRSWVYSDVEKKSMSILKEELSIFLSQGWMKGRKLKF